ncbi:MAG: CheR family methyltransferase, partial [Planctomycetota bacterium]
MSLDAIDSLILSHYGLATRVMGPKALGRAVNRRLDALGLGGEAVDTYTELLRTSDDERQELLELLVVPETWFFRNEKVWPWLVRWATNEWRPKHPGQQLRVLSLACATGEEPWSIAMTLRDGGWSPRDFSIEAVDISSRAL